jgi:hypothetical protein
MTYSYDRRNRTESQEKYDDYVEGLMGMCGDAASEVAEGLYEELDKDTESGALSGPGKFAKDILENLRIAESVEKLSDLVACVKEAQSDLVKLDAALKVARKEAKRDKDKPALEAIADAADSVRALKRELKSIEGEIADAPEEPTEDEETEPEPA